MLRARDLPLFSALIAGSLAVYLYRADFAEPSRPLFVLAVLGFVLARDSDRALGVWSWGALVAATLWVAQTWAAESFSVWTTCSVFGAWLAIRAGGRAMAYLLPRASEDSPAGMALRAAIRRELVVAVVIFLAVYLSDGVSPGERPALRLAALFFSAMFFLRYLLLQGKHLGIAVVPIASSAVAPAELVFRQRWPVLALVTIVAATPLPGMWLEGQVEGPLLLTSTLLFVFAGLWFALALARSGWPKSDVRKASFVAGIALAFVLGSVVAELQGATPERFTVFGGLALAFLLVPPLAQSTTKLFEPAPRLSFAVPPAYFSLMAAPIAGASDAWQLSTLRGFLLALALLVGLYYTVVSVRHGDRQAHRGDALYSFASFASVAVSARVGVGGEWEVFALSTCYVFYAIDARVRAGSE